MQSEFTKWRKRNIYDNAWSEWSYLKRFYVYLEWWCSVHYISEIIIQKHPKKSPSGYTWALYQLPWYAKYVSKLEFKLRKVIYK